MFMSLKLLHPVAPPPPPPLSASADDQRRYDNALKIHRNRERRRLAKLQRLSLPHMLLGAVLTVLPIAAAILVLLTALRIV